VGGFTKHEADSLREVGKEMFGNRGMFRCEREGGDINVWGTLCNRTTKDLDKSESILNKLFQFFIFKLTIRGSLCKMSELRFGQNKQVRTFNQHKTSCRSGGRRFISFSRLRASTKYTYIGLNRTMLLIPKWH
jgi:hypothetical protein